MRWSASTSPGVSLGREDFLSTLEANRALGEPGQLRERLEALDRLELLLLDGRASERARALQDRLEASNRDAFGALRGEIQRGAGASALARWVPTGAVGGEGYDYLDALIAGVLQFELADEAPHELPAEMAFYQPTPARHILDLLQRAQLAPEDVLVDLGSGLGHVPLLVAMGTGARSVGVELQPAYVDAAQQCARDLNLTCAAFVQSDARAADLSMGTVFYLYTPFTGSILQAVLDGLHQEAERRAIRVCTFGPCTPTVAQQPWLATSDLLRVDRTVIFHSPR